MALETSILKTVKKLVGVPEEIAVFDLDIIVHINSAFATLHTLGLGPDPGFMIEDDQATWDQFMGNDLRKESVKTLVALMVRQIFDPPSSSYAVTAMQDQIRELQWRLNIIREGDSWTDPQPPVVPEP